MSSDGGQLAGESLRDDQEESILLGAELVTAMEEQGKDEKAEPVWFTPHEFRDLAEHVNPCAQTAPRDFLMFDCTDMGEPLRGILYESDHRANTNPVGEQEWDISHTPSMKEVET